MAYNKAFNPDALPAHAEPEQAAQAMSALAAYRKPSPSGRTGSQPAISTSQAAAPTSSPGNRRPSPAAIAAQHSYRPQGTPNYHDSAVPSHVQTQHRLDSPPPANYGHGPRPDMQSAGPRRPSNPPSQLPSRTPAPPDADSPDLYPLFKAANVSRTGALTTQELGSALVNADFTPFDSTTIKSLMRMFTTSPPAQANGPTITFAEFQSLWRFLAAWRALFERFDEDYSGRISLGEFSKALVAFGYRLSQPFVTLLYRTYNDRGIRSGGERRRSSVGQVPGQDLGMSFDLFVQACISLKRMTDVFKRYDEDRDGYITGEQDGEQDDEQDGEQDDEQDGEQDDEQDGEQEGRCDSADEAVMSFFGKFKPGTSTTSPNATSSPKAKDANAAAPTPLERMLADAGPIRNDGSDNLAIPGPRPPPLPSPFPFPFPFAPPFPPAGAAVRSTDAQASYCNSILQCLYFSTPFRENVLNYPQRSRPEAVNAAAKTAPPRPALSAQANGAAKKPMVPPSPRTGPGQPPTQKTEDKDSPEYKKKQALMAGPILNLGYQNAEAYEMPESLFTSLKDMFEAVVLSDKRSGVISPIKFLEVLRKENEMFRSAMHQDAHEFLNLLLNAVVENIEAHDKKVREKQQLLNAAVEKIEADDKTEQEKLLLLASRDDGFDSSSDGLEEKTDTGTVSFPPVLPEPTARSATRWLHELFEGTLTSETRCLTCENTSRRDEPFLDLSVDLEQHSSVTACLRRFSEEEMLCERNKFHCDNCGGLQEAEKRMKIKRLPKVLALHLKRFKYTEDLQRLQKLFHKVVYPYHLRLFNTTDDAEDRDRMYELYAVVVHIGGGPYHGHYVAIIKTQDRGWLLFDDEMVEPVDRSFVRNFFGDKAGMACAYVLFYQETNLDAIQREQRMDGRRRQSQDAAVGLGLNAKDSAEMHRVFSSPSEMLDDGTLPSLAHAATAPPLTANGHIEPQQPVSATPSGAVAGRPTSPVVQSKKEKQKEEKARKAAEKQAEKDRAHAEKQAEKDRAQAEKDRRQAVTDKMTETRKKQEADLRTALEASKVSKSEEDKRRGVELTTANGVNGLAPGPKGLDVFRRSKSLRFGSLAKRDKEKERPTLPAMPAMPAAAANGHAAPPELASAIVDDEPSAGAGAGGAGGASEQPKEKEKKNRFSLRKKSFGMLS
ncbi:hypothetical protein DV737_g2664, partial [Chaetothyriales sp. CBS 132003]